MSAVDEARVREIVREELAAHEARGADELAARVRIAKVRHADLMTDMPAARYEAGRGWQPDLEHINRLRADAGLPPVGASYLQLKLAQREADRDQRVADAVLIARGVAVGDDPGQIPAEPGGDRRGGVLGVGLQEVEDSTESGHGSSPLPV